MIRIRLARHGKKGAPFYRIVATDKRTKRRGFPQDVLGIYNPGKNELRFDREKLKLWIARGAKPTATVKRLVKI